MFKTRLIFSWLVICLFCMVAVYVLASHINYVNRTQLTRQSVDDSMFKVSASMKIKAAERLYSLRRMAEETTLIDIIESNNGRSKESLNRLHNQSWSYVEKANMQLSSNMFMLVNSEGKVIARQSDRSQFGDGIKGLPVVTNLLNGISSENVQVFNNEVVHMFATPIVDRSGNVLGGFVAGFKIDKTLMMKLQSDFKKDFAVFIEGKVIASSSPMPNITSLEAQLAKMKDDGYKDIDAGYNHKLDDLFFSAVRFNKDLKEYNTGLLAYQNLPSRWLGPDSMFVIYILAGGVAVFIAFIIISMFASRWIKSKSNAQAQIIRSLIRGDGFKGQFNLKKTGAEFSEMNKLINELIETPVKISKQGSKKAPEMEDESEQILSQPPQTIQPPKPPVKRKFTEAEKRALEKRESEKVMNEISSMVSTISSVKKTEDEKPPVKPDKKEEPSVSDSGFTPVKGRVVENLTLEADKTELDLPDIAKVKPEKETQADDDGYFESVYNEFLNLRGVLGQPTHNVNKEKFLNNLKGNAARIKKKTGCAKVEFTVFEKSGKASVKAVPVK